MKRTTFVRLALIGAIAQLQPALAAVSADEAAQLKTTLTPLGGERAGNKDGSIPAWSGGGAKVAGTKVGDVPVSVFPGEKPALQITAANLAQYAD